MSKLKVFINETHVGFASGVKVDQPWFSATFDPLAPFAQFETLFDSLNLAYADKRYEDVNRLSPEIQRLHISLVQVDGVSAYATNPTHDRTAPICTVRVQGGLISWRPGTLDIHTA